MMTELECPVCDEEEKFTAQRIISDRETFKCGECGHVVEVFDEPVYAVGEITLNHNFWECDCRSRFAHKYLTTWRCSKCGRYADESPDARQTDVERYFDSTGSDK
jgi:uncharacterized Zn finger protein